MNRRLLFLFVIFALIGSTQTAWSQSNGTGLISTTLADQSGLSRNWFTQLPFNPFGDRIADISLYVSQRKARCVHEVVFNNDRVLQSDQDLDAFHKPQGREKAKQKADNYFASTQKKRIVVRITPRRGVNGASVMTVFDAAEKQLARAEIFVVGTEEQKQTGRASLVHLVEEHKVQIIAIEHGEFGIQAARLVQDLLITKLAGKKLSLVRLVRHYEPEVTLSILTERGTVVTLDAETGRILWRRQVGSRKAPAIGVACTDDYTVAVTGVTLYVINRIDGKLLWEQKTTSSDLWKRPRDTIPSASPAVSEDTVFLPALNGRLQAFYLHDEERPPDVYLSPGRVMVKPTVGKTTIAWPSVYGRAYVSDLHKPNLHGRLQDPSGSQHQVDSLNDIVAPLAYLPDDKYVSASLGGFVTCFFERGGKTHWRLSVGEPVSQTPILVGSTAFVIGENGGMFSIDINKKIVALRDTPQLKAGSVCTLLASAGKDNPDSYLVRHPETAKAVLLPRTQATKKVVLNWESRGVSQFISASKDRLYCLDSLNRLVVLDQKTGTHLAKFPTNGVDFVYLNTQTDRLYFGSKSGLLQCFRESHEEYPLIHAGVSTRIRRACDCEEGAETPGQPVPGQPNEPNQAVQPQQPVPQQPAAPNPFGGSPFGKKDDNKKPEPNPFK